MHRGVKVQEYLLKKLKRTAGVDVFAYTHFDKHDAYD